MIDHLIDALRIVNAVLAVVYVAQAVRAVREWRRQSDDLQLLLLNGAGFIVVTGWASVESFLADAPPGSRTVLYSLLLVHAIYAMHRLTRRSRREHPHD